jgi:hypothetical protein
VGYPDANNDGFVDSTGTDETTLQIGHYDPPNGINGWVFQRYELANGPPPPYSDTGLNTVCASVDHLSQFALVTTTASVGGLVSIVAGDSSSVVSTWLWVTAIAGSSVVLASAGVWIERRRRQLG